MDQSHDAKGRTPDIKEYSMYSTSLKANHWLILGVLEIGVVTIFGEFLRALHIL